MTDVAPLDFAVALLAISEWSLEGARIAVTQVSQGLNGVQPSLGVVAMFPTADEARDCTEAARAAGLKPGVTRFP